MSVTIVPVVSKREREQFLRVPWRIFRNDPAWIPNLLLLQRESIDPKKNPFFDHADVQLFLGLKDGRPAGRISAQIDHDHNSYHAEKTGFFGFFDCIDDAEVAAGLFEAAEQWLRARGMEAVRGPFNFSINQPLGLLVEGFDKPPQVDTTHALPYYGDLVEGRGYAKCMDLYAYRWDIKEPPARMMESVEKARAVPGLRVRQVEMRHLKRDVDILLDVYNETWQDNWGYVPVTPKEAHKLAEDLKLIADPSIGLIAEMNGEPAGMILAIPNLNEAIRDLRGFLNPWNALKLVWRLKVRRPKTARLIIFGVKHKFRGRGLVGLPFLLLYEIYAGATKRGYEWGEMSWVLETNGRLNAIMPYWDAYIYKRYRIYEKQLKEGRHDE